VETFVQKQQPPFPVYLRKPGRDQEFIDGIDPAWSGSLPALLIFDAKGKRKALLEGEHRMRDILKVIDTP
jgi:hypothetical protein